MNLSSLGDGNKLYGWLPFFTIYSLKRGDAYPSKSKLLLERQVHSLKDTLDYGRNDMEVFPPLPYPMSVKVCCKYPRGNGYSHCKHQAVKRVMYPDQSIHAATRFVFIHFQEEKDVKDSTIGGYCPISH